MAFVDLQTILAPPLQPPRAVDWTKVEEGLNVALPTGYKELVGLYGPGSIDEFLWLYSPAAMNPSLNLIRLIDDTLEALRSARGDPGHELPGIAVPPAPETVPFPIYPEPGGLLPWAGTDNGDMVYWETTGSADDWRIVVSASRLDRWFVTVGPAADWLLRVLSRHERVPMFPNDFPSASPRFSPAAS
jgi:SUKH superfamily protein